MTRLSRSVTTVATFVAMAFVALPDHASAQHKPTRNSPVGVGWDSKVRQTPTRSGQTLTAEQIDAINSVNAYFNQIRNLQGRFVQTNPDKRVQRGKFYLMRPGRFRFDYRRPSRQVIVSDGTYLAIQDLDLNNEDVYSLENTPFRILLRERVDLLRDAKILSVYRSEHQIAVTITDKSPDAPGQITVYLVRGDVPELAGWVTTDMQGGVTKVEVSNLSRPARMRRDLFERRKLFMKSIQ